MRVNNSHVLYDYEKASLNNEYSFSLEDDLVIVKVNKMNRLTKHSKNEKFSLNGHVCKITISPQAVELWSTQFQNYTLIDVQNAINILDILYQEPTIERIEEQLKRDSNKIKTI